MLSELLLFKRHSDHQAGETQVKSLVKMLVLSSAGVVSVVRQS